MSDQDKARPGVSVDWLEREAWEEIEHLASTALQMLNNRSTRAMAMSLAQKVEACIQRMNMINEQRSKKHE